MNFQESKLETTLTIILYILEQHQKDWTKALLMPEWFAFFKIMALVNYNKN